MVFQQFMYLMIPISIITINYPLLKNKIMFQDKKKIGKKCRLKKLRSDICLKNKFNHCPMSSYKQCTNNNMPVNKCLCEENSFELCSNYNQYSEKCFMKNYSKLPDLSVYPKLSKDNPRVNLYRTPKSKFDYI